MHAPSAHRGEGPIEARFVRLNETSRSKITLYLDDQPLDALEGDTLLAVLLLNRGTVRRSEFGDGPRAGFCLMGACQDCWVSLADGGRLRACTTPAAEGLRLTSNGTGWGGK